MRETEVNHLKDTKRIACSFCRGTGKDPFGQLYPGSTCQVCSGRKEIHVHAPYKTCSYCHGTGIEFSTQNTCTACLGKGVVSYKKTKNSAILCDVCNGTGMNVETDLPCAACKGQGEKNFH